MPCHTTNSRVSTLDGRISTLESSMEALPQFIRLSIGLMMSSLSTSMATKLAVCFEQLCRELSFGGGGPSSSDPAASTSDPVAPPPILTDDTDFHSTETTPEYPRLRIMMVVDLLLIPNGNII